MLGRTNVLSLGSGGGSGTVDLPTHPKSISVIGGNECATVKLTYSDTDYITGIEVRYKTDVYPTSPTDGLGITASGAAESILVSELINQTRYYFRVYLYREIDGIKYYQTDDTNCLGEATPNAVAVSGIEPAIVASNYILIDTSGEFTLNIPEGVNVTVHLVGGGCHGSDGNTNSGGRGGDGGYYKQHLLTTSGEFNCKATIGASRSYGYGEGGTYTQLVIDSETVTSQDGTFKEGGKGGYVYNDDGYGKPGTIGYSTQYGYIGSGGGGGGYLYTGGPGGIGAGSGGDRENSTGTNGTDATNYGCGGGGGGSSKYGDGGKGGLSKIGCIIFEW